MWFFDKGFAFRISERFQSIDEFKDELKKFESPSFNENLDLMEQFEILDKTVIKRDRNVQLASLRGKYVKMIGQINRSFNQSIEQVQKHQGQLSILALQINSLRTEDRPPMQTGELMDNTNVHIYQLKREHIKLSARVILVAFGVGMQIHFYATSCVLPTDDLLENTKQLVWEKVASIEENMDPLTPQKKNVITNYINTKLAQEIRNITRRQ